MVYYRKYRPQTIGELDNPRLRETLISVLPSKEIPHAFLFTGPKGLGKTSTARIIAKVVNCTHTVNHPERSEGSSSNKKLSIEPCNICDQCVSITNGTNIDVLEIDGASNRGIDEIRDLRDKVKLAPAKASKKVYIIDEVHMLTTEAFNALLKTIEEPPGHVVFIFCTTEPQKVPATIVSRCFHISLNLATHDELIHSLERIVKGEKLEVNSDVLDLIAERADGGFRDASKILEELVLTNGQKITMEMFEKSYKVSGISYLVSGILESLKKKDQKSALENVQKALKEGIDMKLLIFELLSALHALLLEEIGVAPNTKYKIQNTNFSLGDIKTLAEFFDKAYSQTKYAAISDLPLELAVVQWCSMPTDVILNDSEGSQSIKRDSPLAQNDNKHTMDSLLKKEKNLKIQKIVRGEPEKKEITKPTNTHSQVDLNRHNDPNILLMENIIYKVKPYNHSVAGVLRGCRITKFDDGELVFQTAYKFHKDRLDDVKTKEILEKIVKEVSGKNIKILVELTK